MVALPDPSVDPTLQAIHRLIEERENAKPKRDYLGASIIGHSCERFIWYNLNHADKGDPITYKGLYAIEDGHRTEELLKERLRLVSGVELWDLDENQKDQIGFVDGKFSGHVDGVILGLLQAPKTPHIFEAKACNEKKFNELIKLKDQYGEKDALEQWDYTYFAQAQSYMHYLDMERHYLVCATPGGRDMVSCRTEFQKDRFQNLMMKKDRIIAAKTAPERITSHRGFYICKFCRFAEFCWAQNA